MRLLLVLILSLTTTARAVVIYRFVPSDVAGTNMNAIFGAEGYWSVVTTALATGAIQNYATWGINACQHAGEANTITYVSNTKTAYANGTLTARVSLGMSQFIMTYRTNAYTLQAGQGGWIPSGGYCLRYVGGWSLQYSNGTAFGGTLASSAAAAPGTDCIVKIYFNGTTHAAWANGVLLWSITDSSKTTGGGFGLGGYSSGTNRYAAITVDDGTASANGQRSPLWYNRQRNLQSPTIYPRLR